MNGMVDALTKPFTGRLFYGWYIVGIAFICNMLSSGTGGYTLGLFIGPMSNDLSWNATTITFGQTIKTWANGLAGPLLGPMVDRFGARAIMLFGGLLGGASLIALAWVEEPWQFYLLYSGFGAIGIAEFGGLVTNATIAKWFIRRRGQAMAYTAMGVSMGGTLFIPATQALISLFDWRVAWMFSGIMIWVLLLPAAFFFMRNRPEDMGLRPDGDAPAEAASGGAAARPAPAAEISWTPKEAFRTRSLWVTALALNIGGIGLGAMLLHNPRIIASQGFSPEMGAAYASLFAIMALVSKPAWGYLMDRIPMRFVNMLVYLGGMASLSFLFFARDNLVMVTLYTVCYGFCMGAMSMITGMTWASYYGRAFTGTIQGLLTPFQMVFSSLSPLYAAWILDRTGSYDVAVMSFMATYALAAALMYFAVKPVYPGAAARQQ